MPHRLTTNLDIKHRHEFALASQLHVAARRPGRSRRGNKGSVAWHKASAIPVSAGRTESTQPRRLSVHLLPLWAAVHLGYSTFAMRNTRSAILVIFSPHVAPVSEYNDRNRLCRTRAHFRRSGEQAQVHASVFRRVILVINSSRQASAFWLL